MVLRIRQTPSPVGALIYRPAEDPPLGGIVCLHGSEGGQAGWNDVMCVLLAAHGFAAMARRYTGSDALLARPDIDDVPLEGTEEALRCMREIVRSLGVGVGLYGVSRGAEHALLLTSLLAEERSDALPDAVAVHSPQHTIWPAFILSDFRTGKPWAGDRNRPAWRWRGSHDAVRPGSPIRIESYDGPVFMTQGTADEVWSAEGTRALERKLRAAGRDPEMHYFEGEGHTMKAAARNRQLDLMTAFFKRHLVKRTQN